MKKRAIRQLENSLNRTYTLVGLLYELENNNLEHYLYKNIDNVNNIDSLVVIYSFVINKKNCQKIVKDNLVRSIKDKILYEGVNYYLYDFLFLFCINEDMDFKIYSDFLEDKRLSFDDDMKFSYKSKGNCIKKVPHSWREGEENYILTVNIKKVLTKDKKIDLVAGLDYLTLKNISSSSMKTEEENQNIILKLFDFNNEDMLKICKSNNYNGSYRLFTSGDVSVKALEKEGDILFNKEEMFFKIWNDPEYKTKYELIIKEKDKNSFSFEKNTVMTFENKLEFFNNSLATLNNTNCVSYYLKHKRIKIALNYFLNNISSIEDIKSYKYIVNLCTYIYINQLEDYKRASEEHFLNTNSLKFDMIVPLVEVYDDFFENELKKELLSMEDIKDKVTLIDTIYSIFGKKEFKEVFYKIFDIDKIINMSFECNKDYFYEVYKTYSEIGFYRKEYVQKLIIQELIDRESLTDLMVLFKSFRDTCEKMEDFNQFVCKNFEEIMNKYKDFYFVNLFFNNGLLGIELFESNLKQMLITKEDDYYLGKYFKYIKNVSNIDKFIKELPTTIQFKIRFNFYFEEKEELFLYMTKDQSIFTFLENKEVDILSNYKILDRLIGGDSDDKSIIFIGEMIDFLKSVTILNDMFEVAQHVDISIDDEVKEKFYYMCSETVEGMFEI